MLHVGMIETGVGPLNLRNILLQNGPIKNTKPRTQIQSQKSPTP
jgi:hypothetical protein